MIRTLLTTLFLVAFGMQSLGQIYTPFGSVVPNATIRQNSKDDDWKAAEKATMLGLYPQATFVGEATDSYNCHGYAWSKHENGIDAWIINGFNNTLSVYWTDGSYEGTTESDAVQILYDNDDHSAIKSTPSGYVISKWGSSILARHPINHCPYNSSTTYHYYRPRPLYIDVWNNDTGVYIGNTNSFITQIQNSNTKYHLRLNMDAVAYLTGFQWEVPSGWTVYYTDSTNGLLSINTNSSPGGMVTLKAKSTNSGSVLKPIITAYFYGQ